MDWWTNTTPLRTYSNILYKLADEISQASISALIPFISQIYSLMCENNVCKMIGGCENVTNTVSVTLKSERNSFFNEAELHFCITACTKSLNLTAFST